MRRSISQGITAVALATVLAITVYGQTAPVITSFSPTVRTAGASGNFPLTLTGTNFCADIISTTFVPGSSISFNGVSRPDTSASTTSATATILATEIPATVSTPTNFPVSLTATFCGGLTSNTVNFVINPPLTTTPASLPNGAVGSPYVRTISASGGTTPYATPTIATGNPPPFTATAGAFSINFTPASATSYNWALNQTDSGGGSVTANYAFSVAQPSSVATSQGTPQSATVNTNFATTLQVLVLTAAGGPVEGAQVTFTAPGSGASGTFANPAVVFTDATGHATAPTFKANTTAGSYSVVATVAGIAASASFSLTNTAGPAATISTFAGTPQSTTVNTAFATLLKALVRDSFNNPVAGASVTFAAPASGASGTFASSPMVTTDATGVATAPAFTANTKSGSYTVTATTSIGGVPTPASFSLTNNAGAATAVTATAGTPQSAQINTAFATNLQATVTDSFGNGVSGVNVVFFAPTSGASGTFAGSTTVATNASGVANAPAFTANAIAGGYTVTATASTLPAVNFSLTNTAGPPGSITATNGTPQSTTVNTTFEVPLQATVKDAAGNPVSGVNVIFAAPGSGASGTFASSPTVATNASGIATAPAFTANTVAGSYTVTAMTAGVTSPASFSLTNIAGPAASVTATAGTPQSTQINTVFAIALQAKVTDSFGNPITDVSVTFTAPQSGASGTFSSPPTVGTNASGVATAPTFTANAITGSYTVSATALQLPPASFSLTNTAGPPGSITATAGTPQSATVNTAFAIALQATVKDANGNPAAGVSVTFTAPGSGASGDFSVLTNVRTSASVSATVTTDRSGVATAPTFTANTIAGSYTVTATTTGVAIPASFSLTNNPGAPASITATAGTPQSATIQTAFAVAFQATVKDSFGNIVSGTGVTFAAPGGGASGNFGGSLSVSTNTNAAGVATAPTFTANGIAGSYAVTATTGALSALFSVTNTGGAPFSITATGGTPQSTLVGSAFPNLLQATVRDVGGSPVANALVTFGAPTSGPSATFGGPTTVATNAGGVATSPGLVANGTEGSYIATATVAGVATPALFSLTNSVGLTITTTQLPVGTVGQPYNASVGATGGSGGYTFSVLSGALPAGLTFSAGAISGTPSAPGLTPVQFQVKDSAGATSAKTLTLRVVAQLTIVTSSDLPAAFLGQGYSITFSAIGGEPPYSWSAGGGATGALSEKEKAAVGGLPPGMTFDSLTGTLSGTPTALGDYSFGVQVTDTAQRKASKAFSLTSATSSSAPAVQVSQATLDFQGPAGGDNPPPQYVSVVASNQLALEATIETDGGGSGSPAPPWLHARFVSAMTPARLAIITDQAGLPAGSYNGRVLVKYGRVQTLVVNVGFVIDLTPPQLVVAPTYLRFAAIAGLSNTLERVLLVRNAGTGGAIDFTASVVSSSPWLTVTPGSGKTVVGSGVPVRVIVNAQGLAIGSRLGKIRLQSPQGGTVDVPVSLLISESGPIIGLGSVGARFDAVEGNGLANSRDIAMLNTGTGTVNWRAELKSGGEGWLSLSPTSGQVTPNAAGKLTIRADPKQLKSGRYYALVWITDPAALNSPQFLVIVLNVRPANAAPEPDLSPAGLYFTAVAGGAIPAAQTLTIYGGGDTPVAYQAAGSSDDGAAWLKIDKQSGNASTQSPGQIQVSVNQANLKPGVYSGDVSVSFSSQTIRTANVTLIVLPQGAVLAAPNAGKDRGALGCAPARLSITSNSLVNAFASPAGWPSPLSARVTDDCGAAVANAQVVATFSNGDPPLSLSLTNPNAAEYAGTWAPGRAASQMTVTLNGVVQGLASATARLTGMVGLNTEPTLTGNGTVNNVTGEVGAALAPGTVVQIFGGSLTPATTSPGVIPLPTAFNNTSVLIGPFVAPLYYLSDGQINAQIPTELQPDRQYPILVNSGGAFTLPDTITITRVSPGLLRFAQHADFSPITAASPAGRGEPIILYLIGMGATNPTVASGAASPAAPPAPVAVQPAVTFGGITASTSFAGLTPASVGLYQINATVPDNVTPGDVTVTVTQGDTASNSVTIPVQ